MTLPDLPPPQPLRAPALPEPRPALAEPLWYLPGFAERLRLMGWRVIYFLPLVPLLLLMVFVPFLMVAWWKLTVFAIALPVTAGMRAAHRAIKSRTEPFCIHCGYDLTGLPDGHRCPECGNTINHWEIDEYRRDPHWFIQRWRARQKLPAADTAFRAGPNARTSSNDGT